MTQAAVYAAALSSFHGEESKVAAQGRAPPREVAWIITRPTATPAKYVGRVYALDEEDAIARAIEEFKIPANLHNRLMARKEQ